MSSRVFFSAARRLPLGPREMLWLARHAPLWAVRRLREARLLRTLRHVWENSPLQRRRWQDAGVALADLRSPDVLPHLPFTTGDDLVERPEEFFCAPPRELVHLFTSSGSLGRPKPTYLTADDLDHHLCMVGAGLRTLPEPRRLLVMFRTRTAHWAAGQVPYCAARRAGLFALLSGTEHAPSEQVELIRRHRITVLATSPTYLHRITLESPRDVRTLGVRCIMLATQPWSQEFRRKMESAWGARLLDAYGASEFAYAIASECIRQSGLHVCDVDFWAEIVDPATGGPLADGREGEVVITTLSRLGMPLVRYRMRDLAHRIPRHGRCPCGAPFRKISRIRGRLDDMIILGVGTNVYPDAIDRAVLSVPGVTDYQLVIEKDSYKDVLNVTVEHEAPPGDLRDRIARALRAIPELRDGLEHSLTVVLGRVDVARPGSLAADRPKTRRILDRRPSAVRAAPTAATSRRPEYTGSNNRKQPAE